MFEKELKNIEEIVKLAIKHSDGMLLSQSEYMKTICEMVGDKVSTKILIMPMVIYLGTVLLAISHQESNLIDKTLDEIVRHIKDYLATKADCNNKRNKH